MARFETIKLPPPAGLTRDAREALGRYDWPGNIRELRNLLERVAIRGDGSIIDANHLGLQPAAKPRGCMESDLRSLEHDTIVSVLLLRKCARVHNMLWAIESQTTGRVFMVRGEPS
jgi:DNA-binding NtrC family response regulator